jgi:hypothetical protein
MIATLLAMMFAGAAIFALGAMVLSWMSFAPRFQELRAELRKIDDPISVRYAWRDVAGPQRSATVYSLDFRAKADALPFHPELRDLPVAA